MRYCTVLYTTLGRTCPHGREDTIMKFQFHNKARFCNKYTVNVATEISDSMQTHSIYVRNNFSGPLGSGLPAAIYRTVQYK